MRCERISLLNFGTFRLDSVDRLALPEHPDTPECLATTHTLDLISSLTSRTVDAPRVVITDIIPLLP